MQDEVEHPMASAERSAPALQCLCTRSESPEARKVQKQAASRFVKLPSGGKSILQSNLTAIAEGPAHSRRCNAPAGRSQVRRHGVFGLRRPVAARGEQMKVVGADAEGPVHQRR